MASLRAAPEVISSSHKSLLCLQTPEGKCFVTWDKSWGMSSEIWNLDFIFWTSVFMVLGIKTGATKGLGGLQPFICERQKQLPRPLLHPYLESLCRTVRANNSPLHFLGQGCWPMLLVPTEWQSKDEMKLSCKSNMKPQPRGVLFSSLTLV